MNVLLATTPGTEGRLLAPIHGVPVGLRAILSAQEAGAERIEVAGPLQAVLLELGEDPRVRVPVRPYEASREERVVVEAAAVVAPDLLRGLRSGEALLSDTDQLVAARKAFAPGEKPSTPLSGLPVMEVPKSAHLWCMLPQSDEEFRRAARVLRVAAAHPGGGWLTRAVIDPLAGRLALALIPLRVPPAGCALGAGLATLTAALRLGDGGAGAARAGALWLGVAWALAVAGGALARLTLQSSGAGRALGAGVHGLLTALPPVSLLLGLARSKPWVVGVALGALFVWAVGAVVGARRAAPRPRGWLRELAARDHVIALVIVAALADARWPWVVLWPLIALAELWSAHRRGHAPA